MNPTARFFLVLLLALPGVACAQQSPSAGEQCAKSDAPGGPRKCLEALADKSEVALEQAEASMRTTLQQWEASPSLKIDRLERFKESSADFWRYRNSECRLLTRLATDDASANEHSLLCFIELSQRRVADLSAEQARLH